LCFSCVVSKVDEPEYLPNFNYQTAISLEVPNSATDINGIFPEQIFIKTPTQTFNRDYQFCLVDGLIYYKSLPNAKYSNPGINEEDWQLLKETGLPFAQEQRKFSVPNQIVKFRQILMRYMLLTKKAECTLFLQTKQHAQLLFYGFRILAGRKELN
jgi:hypothetical protein